MYKKSPELAKTIHIDLTAGDFSKSLSFARKKCLHQYVQLLESQSSPVVLLRHNLLAALIPYIGKQSLSAEAQMAINAIYALFILRLQEQHAPPAEITSEIAKTLVALAEYFPDNLKLHIDPTKFDETHFIWNFARPIFNIAEMKTEKANFKETLLSALTAQGSLDFLLSKLNTELIPFVQLSSRQDLDKELPAVQKIYASFRKELEKSFPKETSDPAEINKKIAASFVSLIRYATDQESLFGKKHPNMQHVYWQLFNRFFEGSPLKGSQLLILGEILDTPIVQEMIKEAESRS